MPATVRTVTVMFTDIVGSTELLRSLGPVASDDARARHFAAMRSAIAVHRGREVKTLGDGFMTAFDSATDALSCAVTMQQAAARAGAAHVRLRVGISAGEVTHDDGDVFGLPVVEASRLCGAAQACQILAADVVRVLVGGRVVHRLEQVGPIALKGLEAPTLAWEVAWDAEQDVALRVALADDSVLLREGIARMLQSEGFEIVLQASDAEELLDGLVAADPHVVVLDVRMPPTHTTEGLVAAQRIRTDHPQIGVLVLSQSVEAGAARRLLDSGTDGTGYLLKERVGDVVELIAAIRTVASGGSAIDPEVVARLQRPAAA